MNFWEQMQINQPELRKRELEGDVLAERKIGHRAMLCMARMYICAVDERSGGGACAHSPAPHPRGVHVSYLGRLDGVGESQARARFLTSGTVQ